MMQDGRTPQGATAKYNIAVVGASSLKGKEIKDLLEERHFPLNRLVLLDAEEAGGLLTEFGDEPAIIQPISEENFEDVSFAIFASPAAFTERHWQMAQSKGCKIIDLSYQLETNPEARLRAPAIERIRDEGAGPAANHDASISVSAHPAAIAIAGILVLLSRSFGVQRSAITVYEPVSEHGEAGVEELHQQTVSLFAFQKISQKVFDSQIAFNMLSSKGEQCRPTLGEIEDRIRTHTQALVGGHAGQPALQVLQAPVFYGYAFSCFVELKEHPSTEVIEEELGRKPFTVCRDLAAQPNVVGAAGSNDIILGLIKKDPSFESGYWIWGALDSLRLPAINAIEIAESLVSGSLK